MTIDKPILDSLLVWAHTWTSGRPVRIEIQQNEFGQTVASVFYREIYGLGDLHPITQTVIAEVVEERIL